MFSSVLVFAVILKLVIVISIVVFAVKLLNRITEISTSQKSIAKSQSALVALLSDEKKSRDLQKELN